jgi:hypothetical protein
MGLTLNYWSIVHEDKGDSMPNFMLWFEKGKIFICVSFIVKFLYV